jgi:hypothetical protein
MSAEPWGQAIGPREGLMRDRSITQHGLIGDLQKDLTSRAALASA